jgi:hypothetical protein
MRRNEGSKRYSSDLEYPVETDDDTPEKLETEDDFSGITCVSKELIELEIPTKLETEDIFVGSRKDSSCGIKERIMPENVSVV